MDLVSHVYQMDESTFIFFLRGGGGFGSDFSYISFHFSMNFMSANRIAPDGTPRMRCCIWGYSVWLYPIKRTPGLYGLIAKGTRNLAPSRLLDGYLSISKAAGGCFYCVNAASAQVISTEKQT